MGTMVSFTRGLLHEGVGSLTKSRCWFRGRWGSKLEMRRAETTMTLTHIREQDVAAELIAVRVVDSDVHPVPKKGVLTEYIPEPWRSNYFLNHEVGERIYYDAPDYAHSYAMRADTFPPDGEFAGSDPEMAFRQVIMEAGVDIAILEPLYAFTRLPEARAAL